jgi:hypothetical protein
MNAPRWLAEHQIRYQRSDEDAHLGGHACSASQRRTPRVTAPRTAAPIAEPHAVCLPANGSVR